MTNIIYISQELLQKRSNELLAQLEQALIDCLQLAEKKGAWYVQELRETSLSELEEYRELAVNPSVSNIAILENEINLINQCISDLI